MDTGNNETNKELTDMRNDYLWDGSGDPDPEIQRLETLLGRFQYNRPTPVFSEIAPARRWIVFPPRVRLLSALATVAAMIVMGVVIFLVHGKKPKPSETPHAGVSHMGGAPQVGPKPGSGNAGWDVSRVAGAPRIGSKTLSEKEGINTFGVGQTLETDLLARASLRAEEVGQIEVEPRTRLRLLNMGSKLKRIALDHGTIRAYIWAPPGQFVVDTPSALAVDLGCAYTLQVDGAGSGLVRTSLGWVGFKLNGRESFVPAGAACATKPKVGPGTPYFEDASLELRSALTRFDFVDNTSSKRREDLEIVLAQSRQHDALTLWHLFARVDESQRVFVYDRLARFNPPPVGITKEGILRLDQPMLDQWWNELGFDEISVWRYWERSWSEQTPQANGTKSAIE
jgi:hypothetical protein